MRVESRNFQSGADIELLHQFIADCWQVYGPAITFHIGDLHWRLRPQSFRLPEQDIRLWFADDQLVAFAWFDPPDSGDLLCHPRSDRDYLEPELLTWLENQALIRNVSSFTVGCFDSDLLRGSLLQSRGYDRQSSFLSHMMRSLTTPVESVTCRKSYSMGCTTTEDLESLANTIALTFDSNPKPTSTYQTLRASRFYQNSLDQVVRSDAGEVVAFCIAWYDAQNKVGLLEPVGCHPEHRRQGLASAVITSVLEQLRRMGTHTTVVHRAGDNAAACGLYKKCGFHPVANDYDWQLTF